MYYKGEVIQCFVNISIMVHVEVSIIKIRKKLVIYLNRNRSSC